MNTFNLPAKLRESIMGALAEIAERMIDEAPDHAPPPGHSERV